MTRQVSGWGASLRLVASVRHAGWVGPASMAVRVFSALYGAGRAVVIGLVVGRVASVASGGGSFADLAGPLVLFGAILALEQLTGSAVEPLMTLAGRRLEEDWRARIRASLGARPDIALLEESETQNDIAVATAGAAGISVSSAVASVTDALAVSTGLVASGLILVGLSAPLAATYVALLLAARSALRAKSVHIVEVQRAQAHHMRRRTYLGTLHRAAAKESRVYGLSGFLLDRHNDVHREAHAPIFRAYWARYRVQLAFIGLAVGVLVVIGVVAVRSAVRGSISPGQATTYILAGESMLMGLAASVSPRTQAWALFDALDRITSRPEARAVAAADRRGTHEMGGGDELLRLEGVQFSYPGSDRPVLDGIDLVVRERETLAIVGVNGAGKTSLIKVIAGLYEPTGGTVHVRGEPLTPERTDAWRAELGGVFQDFVHYPLSVRSNVSLGWGEIRGDLSTVEASLIAAGGGALIEALPSGAETVLSKQFEGGTEISGGQWQRIALARSLYAAGRGAALLLLDEPTANLDVRAELETFDRLRAHSGSAASIIVSHRFSTVRKADRIVVLEAGQVVQEGPHEKLVKIDGLYRSMFLAQAERFGPALDVDER